MAYSAKDISVLKGLEPVRQRPGMYIGSTGPSGLHHLVYEIVDNSVDEAMAGYCTRIDVTILPDGACRVADNGRGMPVDNHPEYKGKSTDQVVLRRCRNVNLSGVLLQHPREAADKVEASIEVDRCDNVNVTGCQVLGARVRGIAIRSSRMVRVADCTIRPREGDETFRGAIDLDDPIGPLLVVNNFLARGSDGKLRIPSQSGMASGNFLV